MQQLVFLAALACGTALLRTIDTAILGTTTDPTGAVIPGATVTIVQPATGVVHTNGKGVGGAAPRRNASRPADKW